MRPLWTPTAAQARQTAMHRFLEEAQRLDPSIRDYSDLHRWSVSQLDTFWPLLMRFCGIVHEGSPRPVLADRRMPSPGFFPNVRLSFTENLLRHRDARPALVSFSEARGVRRLSHAELHAEVTRVAAGLAGMGVGEGDRVAGYIPNISEAVIAMLATASLGAIWSSCSPDFGVQGAVDRFGQIEPKVLFAANRYVYGGKAFDCVDKCQEIRSAIPSIAHVVLVNLSDAPATALPAAGFLSWDALPGPTRSLALPRFAFNQPLYILYSSGTTGIPKCIVHGSGGTLLQHVKELMLHTDLRPDDNIMYFTTCGWMMWNWLASALFCGSSVTLFDGSPTYPDANQLWALVAREGITHFGTSAKFIGSCRERLVPKDSFDFKRLRVILSTGSPLLPEDFDWIYRDVASHVQLSSISGGTDIISCFMLGNPILPVYRGEIQCLGLGMDVAAFNEQDEPVVHDKGELVCRTPFPSMPVFFWDDPDHEKYKKAYFDRVPNIWFHGDYIALTETQGSAGGIVVFGRSDATLKPGGVRIGTAEIYRLVETLPDVEDSVVIGQPWHGDVRVVLFVKPRPGVTWSQALVDTIKATIRAGATPRHVPAVVVPVDKIPYTRSGKKMELAVLEVVTGREPRNKEAMADPDSLDCFRHLQILA